MTKTMLNLCNFPGWQFPRITMHYIVANRYA